MKNSAKYFYITVQLQIGNNLTALRTQGKIHIDLEGGRGPAPSSGGQCPPCPPPDFGGCLFRPRPRPPSAHPASACYLHEQLAQLKVFTRPRVGVCPAPGSRLLVTFFPPAASHSYWSARIPLASSLLVIVGLIINRDSF